MTTRIRETLRVLGGTHNYLGYRHVEMAVLLVLEDEDRLESVVKDVYMAVADQCGCNWNAVERNIRTLVHRAWKINAKKIVEMAGYPMAASPTASEFIEIVANYVRRSQ